MSDRETAQPVRTVRRPCEWCGEPLPGGHGNARYHRQPKNCNKKAAADRSRKNSQAHRRRQAQKAGRLVPDDYENGPVTVSGVALSGQRVLELRALLHGVLRRSNTYDQYLRKIPIKDMVTDKHLLALRGLVDDVRELSAVLDAYLPTVNSGDPYADPRHVAEAEAAGEDPRTYVAPVKIKAEAPILSSTREYIIRLKDQP